jgi:hypothetical protein
MHVWHLSVFFGEVSVKVCGPCFKIRWFAYCWVLRILWIFWISLISDVSFINVFSHSVGCLLILLTSVREQMFLILMKSSLSIVLWIVHLVLDLKSHYHPQGHLEFLLSFMNFIVLCFTFSSVVHFGLIFGKGTRSISRFFSHVDVWLFWYHSLKRELSFEII